MKVIAFVCLFISFVLSFEGQQLWATINDGCNNYPYSNCGSFGGWNISSSSNSNGYDEISFTSPLSNYKPFWGIGAALTESSAYLLLQLNQTNSQSYYNLAESTRKFSSLRIPVGTSDFALSEWTFVSNSEDWSMSSFNLGNDKYQRPVLNDLLNHRSSNEPITLIFSVWTPPIWLKNGNQWDYQNLAQYTSQYYQGVANYWLTFIKNLPYYIVSSHHSLIGRIYIAIQNEPFQSVGNDLPGCSMSVNDQIQILNYVASGLGSINMGGLPLPKLLVLDHNWDLESDAAQIMQGVGSSAAGVAFHAYGGTYTSQQDFYNSFPSSEIHLTEFSGDYTDDPQGTYNWDMGNVFFGSLDLYGQSVTYWNLALDDNAGPLNPDTPGYCTTCNGVFRITDNNSQFLTQPRYFTLGLFSQCIPYGAQRVGVTMSGNLGDSLNVMAYQATSSSPNGVQYCVIVQNNGDSVNFDIEIDGQYISVYVASGDVNSIAIS